MSDFQSAQGFDWDEGNQDKNGLKHGVSNGECEELFFNLPLIIADDAKHSELERRYYALGQTNAGRLLFLSFTKRVDKVRVVSVRDLSRKEREIYGQANT